MYAHRSGCGTAELGLQNTDRSGTRRAVKSGPYPTHDPVFLNRPAVALSRSGILFPATHPRRSPPASRPCWWRGRPWGRRACPGRHRARASTRWAAQGSPAMEQRPCFGHPCGQGAVVLGVVGLGGEPSRPGSAIVCLGVEPISGLDGLHQGPQLGDLLWVLHCEVDALAKVSLQVIQLLCLLPVGIDGVAVE